MNYSISISDNGKYIIVKILDSVTSELARLFSEDAKNLGNEKGIDRFLFDVRQSPNINSVLRNYIYVYSDMEKLELSKTARSAILTNPDDESHDFIETLSKSAGYNVRLFNNEKLAIDWLESE